MQDNHSVVYSSEDNGSCPSPPALSGGGLLRLAAMLIGSISTIVSLSSAVRDVLIQSWAFVSVCRNTLTRLFQIQPNKTVHRVRRAWKHSDSRPLSSRVGLGADDPVAGHSKQNSHGISVSANVCAGWVCRFQSWVAECGNMNNHPTPHRSQSVGSILLTPQENECLFGYLGRKCTVSSVSIITWSCQC